MAIGFEKREKEMERDFEAKLKLQHQQGENNTVQKSKSMNFRAPQEQFTINDFELGKIYGVGSYSKVKKMEKKKEDWILFLGFDLFCDAIWLVGLNILVCSLK